MWPVLTPDETALLRRTNNASQQSLARKLGAGNAAALWALAEEAKADVRRICADHIPEAQYKPGVAHGYYSASEARDYDSDADYLAQTYGYDSVTQMQETKVTLCKVSRA